MDARTDREKQFHDVRYADGVGARPQDSFYSAVDDAKKLLDEEIDTCVRTGGVGIEIGCSNGEHLEQLLFCHAFDAHGIDISSSAIAAAQARFAGQPRPPKVSVMDANNLEYPNETFDFCFGSGVIHHLQLPRALEEARRVLRPGGRIVFMEPLATNPLIQLYRHLTPADRSPDETPLTLTHIKQLRSIFDSVSLQFFGFFTLGALALRRWPRFQSIALRVTRQLDKAFFALPGAWRLAWVVVIKAERSAAR